MLTDARAGFSEAARSRAGANRLLSDVSGRPIEAERLPTATASNPFNPSNNPRINPTEVGTVCWSAAAAVEAPTACYPKS